MENFLFSYGSYGSVGSVGSYGSFGSYGSVGRASCRTVSPCLHVWMWQLLLCSEPIPSLASRQHFLCSKAINESERDLTSSATLPVRARCSIC